MSGVSTPLITKLGYKAGQTVYLLNAPESFETYLADQDTKLVKQLPADWLQLFCKTQAELIGALQTLRLAEVVVGLWLCWPKQISGLRTDLNDQTFRDNLLPIGWVDTKVCAIDETWSGLKFLRRNV